MNQDDKKFILEHPSMSVQELARRLSVKEKKIRHFLQKQNNKKNRVKLSGESSGVLSLGVKPREILLSLIVIFVCGFLVYGRSIEGQWIWDDNHLIKDNVLIRDWSNAGELLSGKISTAQVVINFSFYRPLQMLSYMADYALWGLDGKGFHLTNILLHCSTAAVLFWLVILLFHDQLLALLTSLLFVVHPLHSEAIAYVAGRSDPLAGMLMLLGMVFYIKSKEGKPALYAFATMIAYCGAVLSRETSLILMFLILLYHISFREKVNLPLLFGFLGLNVFYVFIRKTVLQSNLQSAEVTSTLSERIPGFFAAVTTYLKLLVLPFPLHMEYGNSLFKITGPPALLGMLIVVVLLVYALCIRKKQPFVFFGLTWFFVALLPQSNLYPINAYMAEHWLYIPSIGAFLLLAKGFSIALRKKEYKLVVIAGFITLMGYFGYLTWRQNDYWADPETFYTQTLKYTPENWRVQNNLGIRYKQKGEYQKAREAFEKAIALNPNYSEAYNNMGLVYKETGNIEQAIESLQKAITLDSKYAAAYNNLGLAYTAEKNYEKAEAAYQKAILLSPDYANAYHNYGMMFYQKGDFEKALDMLKKALSYDPGHTVIYNTIGSAYFGAGRYQEAVKAYQEAIRYDVSNMQAHTNLGQAYDAAGESGKAIATFKNVLQMDSGNIKAYYNLGKIYEDAGEYDQAVAFYEKTAELKPDYARVFFDLARVHANKKDFAKAIMYCDKAVGLGYKAPVEFLESLSPYRK